MAQMPKASTDAVARFAELVPDDPRIQRKQMFGYPCAVVGGNMFMSLHGDELVLRMGESMVAELAQRDGCKVFEAMAGRQMKAYLAVAPRLQSNEPLMREWASQAFEYTAALP